MKSYQSYIKWLCVLIVGMLSLLSYSVLAEELP